MGWLAGTRPDDLGIVDGRLRPVRTHLTNAVSSFADTEYHRIAPLSAAGEPRAVLRRLRAIVAARPGVRIVNEQSGYLYAEFESRVLGFVDDVEFLLDESAAVIHVRSASRLGRRDFGVNRARVEAIRATLSVSSPIKDSKMPVQTTASGLQYEDVTVGNGAQAAVGQRATVHYTGWLYEDGKAGAKFDSSKDRGDPFTFPLGAGHVIKGWDEGVVGMKIGGTRRLIVPPELGYGARGAGGVIPPNATLLFEVELLAL